jgi:putative flippase GtrA
VARERSPLPGRLAGAAGIASAALLYASVRLVHDWGPVTIALVAAWAAATLVAFAFALFTLCHTGGSRRLAKLGLTLALASLSALALAGLAAASGLGDMPAGCGGG